MFCPQCGTQVSDSATFCRKCGTPLVEGAAPPPTASSPRAARLPASAGEVAPGQPLVGIFVIVGAALAIIGCLLPWIDFASATANGFDGGYLTDSSGGGNDGILILVLSLAGAAFAVHYFFGRSSLASGSVLALEAGAAAIAAYNLLRLIADIRDGCSGCNPLDYVGMGLYVAIAGGLIAAGAALIGLRREMSPHGRA